MTGKHQAGAVHHVLQFQPRKHPLNQRFAKIAGREGVGNNVAQLALRPEELDHRQLYEWGQQVISVVPFADFGTRLFRDFLVPVILVAVLLDIALSGAFVNARRSRDDDTMMPSGQDVEANA